MLSQRIALLSTQLAAIKVKKERAGIRGELDAAVDLMDRSRIALVNGGTVGDEERHVLRAPSANVARIYERSDISGRTRDYLDNARVLSESGGRNPREEKEYLEKVTSAAPGLLKEWDKVVREREDQSNQEVMNVQYVAGGILGTTLALLVVICYLVFKPTVDLVEERAYELEQENERLDHLSSTDPLTGVANRRTFDHFFHHEWRRGLRDGLPLSVVMADIDFFKDYNDSLGHQAGDECLKAVATLIADTLKRPADLMARYGGEEFVVVLPGTDKRGAIDVAEDIRLGVEALKMPHPSSRVNSVLTISLGVAGVVPGKGGALEPVDLLKKADQALYKAKEAGRNQVYSLHGDTVAG